MTSRIGTVEPYGSTASASDELDGWSDLDVSLSLREPMEIERLELGALWAWQEVRDGDAQVLRLVLADGRRVDARVASERLRLPRPPADNAVRCDAALAAVRLGRGDRLIGYHLTLGVLRECLVLDMRVRDNREGTNHHRFGTEVDDRAAEIARIAGMPFLSNARPQIIEEACRL